VRVYVANRTNSGIGLWQMVAEILGGSSVTRKLARNGARGDENASDPRRNLASQMRTSRSLRRIHQYAVYLYL